MREPTPEEVSAYGDAWHDTPKGKRGDRTRAGLRAVFALEDRAGITVPRSLLDALDSVWDSVQEGEHGMAFTSEANDREAMRLLAQLEDAEVGRAVFVLSILRGLASTERADRVFGGPPADPHPEQTC